MIGLPAGTRVWLVAGHTDMRKGFDGLGAMMQTALQANPFCGHVFVFRGDILKGCATLPMTSARGSGTVTWCPPTPTPSTRCLTTPPR